MTRDIKATVEELDRLERAFKDSITPNGCDQGASLAFGDALHEHYPSLLAELRRLWAIEEAAVRYREADHTIRTLISGPFHTAVRFRPIMDADTEAKKARSALFAALPPHKPSGGEEAR